MPLIYIQVASTAALLVRQDLLMCVSGHSIGTQMMMSASPALSIEYPELRGASLAMNVVLRTSIIMLAMIAYLTDGVYVAKMRLS
jgi:hypothetical protein